MNKVSAQKIRSLEIRIAKLEKEAGFVDILDDISGFIKGVVNIPKNFLIKIINAFKDVGNNLKATFSKQHDTICSALGSALGIRVAATLDGFIVNNKDIPILVKFNAKNPIKSTFTGGETGRFNEVPLDQLASLYEGEEAKRIKSAYLSWKSDYASPLELVQGKADKMGIIKRFMKLIQRSSKILYRLMKIVFSVFAIAEVITAPWGQWVLGLALAVIGSYDMSAMANADKLLIYRRNSFYFSAEDYLPTQLKLIEAFPFAIMNGVLKLLEKAFYRYGVNVDAFDDESMGRTASQFPRIASVTRRLEHYAYA